MTHHLETSFLAVALFFLIFVDSHIICRGGSQPVQCTPKVLRKTEPKWPEDLSATSSMVTVKFTIKKNGAVTNIRIAKTSGNKAVDEAAIKAIAATKYRALAPDCKPVESVLTYRLDFTNKKP